MVTVVLSVLANLSLLHALADSCRRAVSLLHEINQTIMMPFDQDEDSKMFGMRNDIQTDD